MLTSTSKEEILTRREFFRKSAKAALTVGALYNLSAVMGCGGLSFKEEEPVIYPPLRGQKVQPPEYGCYIGFHSSAIHNHIHGTFEWLEERTGKAPKIIVPPYSQMMSNTSIWLWGDLRTKPLDIIPHHRATPFLYRDITSDLVGIRFENLPGDKVFGRKIEQYARNVVKLGKPLFFTTMQEMNLPKKWTMGPWGQQPRAFKDVWRYMWQIFEDTGANEYATWVWEIYSPYTSPNVGSPERYYPGDKYVDWIGFSVYSHDQFQVQRKPFSQLIGPTYSHLRKRHPEKPIMIAEFGKTKSSRQSRWIEQAYGYIKSRPGIKAAVYWDNVSGHLGIDYSHHLSEESWIKLKEIFKDDYWIGA
jgi:hypothetical protein